MAAEREGSSTTIFQWVINYPRFIVVVGLLIVALAASFLPRLVKDVRADAFLAEDNPAVLYRDLVKEWFGLSDPLVVVIVADGEDGIYTPAILEFIQQITDNISELPNIDSSRVVSLATEKNISSSSDGIDIKPFLDPLPDTRLDALAVRPQIDKFPLYLNSLVSKNARATLVIAEMISEDLAESSYTNIKNLLAHTVLPEGVTVHVAGEGAVAGYMGRYLDADAQRLVPIACLIITLIVFFAYMRLSPAVLCDVVVIATVVITLGIMAATGVSFYIITSAMPVILIGISVADGIHIYSHYFDLQERHQRPYSQGEGEVDSKALVAMTMQAMWRPITLTSLTTAAGFLGLYWAASMPPFKYFGLFAALGVGIAWVYSLLFLPAAMVLTQPQRKVKDGNKRTFSSFYMASLGRFTLRYSRLIVGVFILLLASGLYSALQLEVDDNPISVFHPQEDIAIADRTINELTNGSNTLDIVVETHGAEELFDPAKLKKIEALQAYVATLPYVGGSVSIVDYLKQMHRAMNEGKPEFFKIPESRDMIAQYFLIYSALSDPTDFEEEVDYDYRMANIRVQLKSGGYKDTQPTIASLEQYISDQFNNEEMSATLSGRVNLNYHWIKDLASSHFSGMIIALILVWVVSALLFRSEIAGIYTLIPVAGAVLGVYAIMVLMGITLGMGTTMFAAIAIGLGIDFAIHTLERLRVLTAERHGDLAAAFTEFFPTTGRALLFNFLAIACGFGVLLASNIMSLISFGGIVMLSIGISFVASMTLLPAMIWLMRPSFVVQPDAAKIGTVAPRIFIFAAVAMGLALFALPAPAATEVQLSADEVVQRVNSVSRGEYVTRNLHMELTDRRGKVRQRDTIGYRRDYNDLEKTALFYLAPANVRDTAFLTWDYTSLDKEDDQWLYLPALRKVRRISAGDRGDYFLGTDFTYDDMKQDGRLSVSDFDYSLVVEDIPGVVESPDFEYFLLESIPKSEKIAKELGYSRTVITIDSHNWVVRGVVFWDVKGQHLKTLHVGDVRQVQGYWTRHELTMENHQTGHRTRLTLSNLDYETPVKESLFTRQALARGH